MTEDGSKEPLPLRSISFIEERSRLGDWEMDLIIRRDFGTVFLTMADPKSRYTVIEKVSNKSVDAVAMAIKVRLMPHRSKLHTLTFDNGNKFTVHAMIDKIFAGSLYFEYPFSLWERGLSENIDGLIR